MDESVVRDALFVSLNHLAERLDGATSPAGLLAALIDGARGLLPFSACALVLPEPWRVWRGTAARPSEIAYNDRIPPEAVATLERFLEHGRPLRIDDLLVPPWSEASHRDVLWKDGTRSAVLVPLRVGERHVAALSFTSVQPDRYSPGERDSVAFLAWLAATTLRALPEREEGP